MTELVEEVEPPPPPPPEPPEEDEVLPVAVTVLPAEVAGGVVTAADTVMAWGARPSRMTLLARAVTDLSTPLFLTWTAASASRESMVPALVMVAAVLAKTVPTSPLLFRMEWSWFMATESTWVLRAMSRVAGTFSVTAPRSVRAWREMATGPSTFTVLALKPSKMRLEVSPGATVTPAAWPDRVTV